MAGLVWKDGEAQLVTRICAYLVCFCVHELYVCVSYPVTDSCNLMATFAFALTGAIVFCSLVLSDQRLHAGQVRYS